MGLAQKQQWMIYSSGHYDSHWTNAELDWTLTWWLLWLRKLTSQGQYQVNNVADSSLHHKIAPLSGLFFLTFLNHYLSVLMKSLLTWWHKILWRLIRSKSSDMNVVIKFKSEKNNIWIVKSLFIPNINKLLGFPVSRVIISYSRCHKFLK